MNKNDSRKSRENYATASTFTFTSTKMLIKLNGCNTFSLHRRLLLRYNSGSMYELNGTYFTLNVNSWSVND